MRRHDIVLITGASSGIGRATALLLAKKGFKVFAGVRSEYASAELIKESSNRLTTLMLDITQPSDMDHARDIIQASIESGDRFYALINNAGYVEGGPLELLPLDLIRKQIEVNLIGHIGMTQRFLPYLRKFRGRIINIGSPAGFFSMPFIGAYNCSKHAFTAFNDTLRRELSAWNIPVTLIIPGFIASPIWDKSYSGIDKLMSLLPPHQQNLYETTLYNGRTFIEDKGKSRSNSPDIVAETILRVMFTSHPRSRYIAGFDGYFGILIQKWIPSIIVDFVTQMILNGKIH